MSLKKFVKVGSITNLSDARYCAGMSVDFLGFSFSVGADQYVSPDKFREIAEWISGVSFVGEFYNTSITDIQKIADQCAIKIVQVSNTEFVNPLKKIGFTVILEVSISEISELTDRPDYLIINSDTEPSEEYLNLIGQLNQSQPVLLATGIDRNNVEQLLSLTNAHGIALKGTEEIKPGFKDYDELADILELLEED